MDGGAWRRPVAGARSKVPKAETAALAQAATALLDGDDAPCPEALRLVPVLCRAVLDGAQPGVLLLNAMARLLAAELVRRCAVPAASARHVGGLAGWQLRRVTEAMDAALGRPEGDGVAGEPPTLAGLAALVGLTPAHFCTAFRQSTGLPPHRWLMQRRTERAKAMLADHTLSLVEIALASGYGSSSHFSTAFRKQTGLTPTAWRRR